MEQNKISPGLLTGIILALFFGIALYIRVYLPYHQIFTGDAVNFTGTDAYYHMRLVDNLVHHFPWPISFDPYTYYPNGNIIGWPPFFDWLIAGIAWLFGLGSPSQHTVDVVGAAMPVILGTLTIVPVYFIGKEIFNRWVGVLAAGLTAIWPGQFLANSIVGSADHHVAETLFSVTTVLFLLLAVKSASREELSFAHIRRMEWKIIKAPLFYSILAGVSLGVYLLTWVGGLFFIFFLFAYFVIQFIIDHLRGRSTEYLGLISPLLFIVAGVICLPVVSGMPSPASLCLPSLVVAALTPVALAGLSWIMHCRKLKVFYYPIVVAGLGLAACLALYAVAPDLFGNMLAQFNVFMPGNAAQTISEVKPLLFPSGGFSFRVAWSQFNTGGFLSLISLGILIYLVIKRGGADKVLLVVWSLLLLIATLGQRRFSYYYAVNAALLTGYLLWPVLQYLGFKAMPAAAGLRLKASPRKKGRVKNPRLIGGRSPRRWALMAVGVVIIFFLSFFPNIISIRPTIEQSKPGLDSPMYEALTWLRDNSPEPFGDPDYYYEKYEQPPTGESYQYPSSAYSVLAIWDYGHWITRIGRRIPVSNPFIQGVDKDSRFLLSQEESTAGKIADELSVKYVILDRETVTSKFYSLPVWVGHTSEEYRDVFYQRQGGKLSPVTLFYPEYYRTMAVRLYTFNGEAVSEENTLVISYQLKESQEGIPYKEIIDSKVFTTYEEAADYVAHQKSGS
ncbi:MAG: oligosaccharyl transferase, archaeosortase A system-associated, partial [Patescibacteria group bacterium]